MATDILMKITKDGNDIPGETLVTIDRQDELTNDFTRGKYIEIKDFKFGVSLVDKDMPGPTQTQQGEEIKYDGKFKKFIEGGGSKVGVGQTLYPVTFDEVTIERHVDGATPILLQSCFGTKPLSNLTIVKRKSEGTGTKIGNIAYLRIDFGHVLITDMSFSMDEALTKEDLKFVYRTITVKYRPQLNTGAAAAVVPAGPLSLVKAKSGPGGTGG